MVCRLCRRLRLVKYGLRGADGGGLGSLVHCYGGEGRDGSETASVGNDGWLLFYSRSYQGTMAT